MGEDFYARGVRIINQDDKLSLKELANDTIRNLQQLPAPQLSEPAGQSVCCCSLSIQPADCSLASWALSNCRSVGTGLLAPTVLASSVAEADLGAEDGLIIMLGRLEIWGQTGLHDLSLGQAEVHICPQVQEGKALTEYQVSTCSRWHGKSLPAVIMVVTCRRAALSGLGSKTQCAATTLWFSLTSNCIYSEKYFLNRQHCAVPK